MNRMTSNRVALFIGVMSAVALVIYAPHYALKQRATLQQQRAEQAQAAEQAKNEAQQTVAQQAAAERTQYAARYLNPGFARKPGLKNVAIAAVADGEPDRPLAVALASRLNNETLVLFTSFFKPSFYADGLFANVFGGSTESIDKLMLTNTLDALLLAQEQVEYSTNGVDLNYVITARTRLNVAFLPFDTMRTEQSWTFAASGAGFSRGEALKNADDRLLKQITGDNNMSLVSSDHQPSYP